MMTRLLGKAEATEAKASAPILHWLFFALGAAAAYLAIYQLPEYGDWDNHYYPTALAELPYDHGLYNPPWIQVILRPFRLLPVHAAGALWVTLSLMVILYSSRKLGADRLGLILILTNPSLWFFITLGQIDALLLLGFVINQKPWDVMLMALKPQVIGVAILFRLREYDRRALARLAAVLVLTLLVWWGWPGVMVDRWIHGGGYQPLSLDIFPWGIPAGVVMLWIAWKRQNAILGSMSTFFLVPYLGPGSHIVYAVLIFSKAPTAARLAAYAAYWRFVLHWVL